MRALIDYRPALRERSGIGEYTHELVRAMATGLPASAVELSVFSSSWKNWLSIDDPDFDRVRRFDRRWPVRVLNFAWHRLEAPTIETLTGDSFDVVHSMTPLLVPSRGAAQVITIADLSFLANPTWTSAEIRRDYPKLVRDHARRADGILVMSRHVGDEVRRLLDVDEKKIALVPGGAPPWTPRAAAPAKGYILFVGTLEPRKNVGLLLEAYERLIDHGVPPLVLAGRETAAAKPWLERIGRNPLLGRVRHLGYVPSADRRALYEGAAVLVLPSLDEGFGLPLVEAMAAGVPVVASRRGSLPEVLGDAGQLVDAEDPQELANAINRVLRDDAFAASCAAKGVERARAFSWERSARETFALYERAIANRRCASV